MKSIKIGWTIILLLSVLLCCFGCDSGGGGGSSKNESSVGVDWQENAVSVQGQVRLPASSPLSMSEISVDLFETSTSPTKNGEVQLKAPDGQIVEAYIMLPAESDDALPVIYLYTTILPGETDIDFSIEETAISLLMSRINQEYLLNAGTPKQVKQIIRDNGADFINEVSATLESDPYALRTDNLENIYTPAFEAAADACRNALMFEASGSDSLMLMAAASASSSNGSQLYVRPQQEQHDFIVYEDTTGLLGLDNWTDLADVGGTMTGQLKIENDTMLFAHYRIHDFLTGSEMTRLQPGSGITGMIGMAFHPDILGPQKGWMRLWWAGTAKKDVDFKSTKVTVFTPASAFDDTASEIEKQIGGGLAFRTGATTLMTVISSFVPIGEDGWEYWFLEMHDRGLLTATYDKFAYGDIMGGIEVLFWTFCDGKLMQSFIKDYIVKYLEKELDAKKVTSQFMNKFNSAVKKVPITKIGLAVDLIKLVDDYNLTPARIMFDRAEFPLNLSDAAPNPVTKVGPDDPLPRITITGMGLGDVYFDGEIHSPQVYLEAENTKGKEKLLNIDKENIFAADEYLYFDLPREWAEIGSDIVGPIYLNVVHSFVCEHGEDELIRMELPHEDHEALFALGFESDVMITAVTEPKPTRDEEITIIGQGFSPLTNNNSVYFTDHTGTYAAADVLVATATTLDVIVPDSLEFGPLTVEVELNDDSVSNEFPLSLHPRPVFADTEDGTHFADTLEVAFMQEEDCDIYYSINSGGIKEYAGGTVEINETSHVYPFARVKVDGVNYDSAIGDFLYYKCSADEELIDGECVGDTNTGLIDYKEWDNWPEPQCCQTGIPTLSPIVDTNNNPDDGTYVKCEYTFNTETIVKSEFFYENGLRNGFGKVYYQSGQLFWETFYTDGKENGRHKEYFENGRVKLETTYRNGIENAVHKEYYESGQQGVEYPISNGRVNGIVKQWHENGQLQFTGQYSDGILVGSGHFRHTINDYIREGMHYSYYENGQMRQSEGPFINGDLRDGYKKLWSEDGTLLHCEHYKDGVFESCY